LHRPSKESEFTHFKLFDQRNWGLIIYDEVHLLPAPVFQIGVIAGAPAAWLDRHAGS
jgi:superfamily II DNA or RNA helicase